MITLLQQVEMAKLNEIKISPVIESLDSQLFLQNILIHRDLSGF